MAIYFNEETFLSQNELLFWLKKAQENDHEALNKIIESSIPLILKEAKRYALNKFDEDDFFQIGVLSIIKSIKTYDFNKNITFYYYASIVIKRDILMMLRKNKTYYKYHLSTEMIFEKQISSFEDDIINKITHLKINTFIKELDEKDQYIIKSFFGLDNELEKSQKEIAESLNVTQSYISKRIKKILNILKLNFQNQGHTRVLK